MPPIELNAARPVAGLETRTRLGDVRTEAATPVANAGRTASASDILAPGLPPVDAERVAEIRKAVENGSYPVTPTRIADAMIAAGFLLRSSK